VQGEVGVDSQQTQKQINEILVQFSNSKERKKIQEEMFGISDRNSEPLLQSPSLNILSQASQLKRDSEKLISKKRKKKKGSLLDDRELKR
jgi:hypothetical protein